MCYICGRENCCPMFHSEEDQQAFAPAGEAYERFLEICATCTEAEEGEEYDEKDVGATP